MGLNAAFITDDTMEPKAPAVKVDALKDTAPGEQPEFKDNVTLIAYDEQWKEEEKQARDDEAALEELVIRVSDLNFLHESLRTTKGMSQQVALECQKIIPDFISDVRPMGSFSTQLTSIGYKAALEEVESEKKGVVGRIIDFIKKIFQQMGDWIAKVLGRKTPSNNEKAVESFGEKMKSKEPDWKKATNTVDAAEVSKTVPEFDEIKTHEDLQAFMEGKPVAKEETKPEVSPEKVRNAVKDALVQKLLRTCSDTKLSYIAVTGMAQHSSVVKDYQGIIEKILDRNFFANSGNREVYEEGVKVLDELDKTLAQAKADQENFLELFAGTLLREKNHIFDTAQQETARKMIKIRNKDLPRFVDMKKLAEDSAASDDEASKAIADNCKLAMRAIKHLFELVSSFDTFYIEFGHVNGFGETTESVPANECMDVSADVAAAYSSPLMNTAGSYAAAGSQLPQLGGFAEYTFTTKPAESSAGTINPDGTAVTSPREAIIRRIEVLQEALKVLDAGAIPSNESVDILSEGMRPMDSFRLANNVSLGRVDRSLFESKLATNNAALSKELNGVLKSMTSDISEIAAMSDRIKKFGIFSKAPAREASAADVEQVMKIADAYQCGVVGFMGQPEQKSLMINFVKRARAMHKTDIFNSRSFWSSVDDLEAARFALMDKLDRDIIDDHAAAAKLVADGLLGNPKDFFAAADEIYAEAASTGNAIHNSVERDIKRYIAISERNGYDNDLKYFNNVLSIYEITVKLVIFVARVCYTYKSIRKEFKA